MDAGTHDLTIWGLFQQADIVVKAVMLMLVVASVWSWAVAIDKWLHFADVEKRAKQFERAFWSGQSIEELDERVSDRPADALARVFAAAAREWREARRNGQLSAGAVQLLSERCDRLMQAAVSRELTLASKGLPVLATIASATPFIGLFGTVWGIMNAFTSIAREQTTNLAVVAPGIAEALFATALGLLAAVPAVIFFNKFNTDVAHLGDRLDGFADEVAARISRRLGERV
jgi:biopolymer transport protein TolQ